MYGNATLSDIKDETGLDIGSPVFDTFTGVVFDRLSAVPKDGKLQITVEFSGFVVQICRDSWTDKVYTAMYGCICCWSNKSSQRRRNSS